jgi:crossover junction endodeoxyribonuclease RuvC
MSLILAIDPGLTGAYALLERTGKIIEVGDLPVIADLKTKWIDGDTLTDRWLDLIGVRDVAGVIERVHPMPESGSQGAFSQGMTLGSLLVSLQIVGASIELVAPQSWKRDLGLISPPGTTDIGRKRASLDKARLLFPHAPLDRQKDHGRAEALLIAHWYLQKDSLRAANKLAKDAAKQAAKSLAPGTTRGIFDEPLQSPRSTMIDEPF